MKTFILICNDFGRKFSFNAKNLEEAESKKRGYERYHSHHGQYTVKEINEENPRDLHNEYMD